MKKHFFILFGSLFTVLFLNAQTNIFPSSGNVGIGTISPTKKLYVNGDIWSTTNITANGFGAFSRGSGVTINIRGNTSHDWQYHSIYSNSSGMAIQPEWKTGSKNLLLIPSGDGNVGIGTTNPKGFKLGVNGKIAAEEVKVAIYDNWADFVFNKNYNLPTLKEVEQHIKEKGHLKDIPNAEEVNKNGVFLGDMNAKLLQKIEELTLYTIEQEKKIEALNKLKEENELLHEKFNALEALVSKMIEKQ